MNKKDDIIKFFLIIIIYLATWSLIDIVINRVILFRNNKIPLYIILLWVSLYILINKYDYKFA